MPPRKKVKRLHQTTLDYAKSSPARPSGGSKRRVPASTLAASSPIRTRSQRTQRSSPVRAKDDDSDSSDIGALRLEPVVIDLSEEESPRRPAAKKRLRRIRVSDDDSESAGSVPSKPNGKGTGRSSAKRPHRGSDSEESDGLRIRLRRRKIVKSVRPTTQEPDDEDDVSIDDLDADKIIDNRMRTRGKKTAFQKNLEKMRRKKLGKSPLLTSEEEDDEELDDSNHTPFKGAKPHQSNASDSETSQNSLFSDIEAAEDDLFIVEDDENAPKATLPAEFSMSSHQDLSANFKVVCQLFTHLAVRPRAERRAYMKQIMSGEEYFSVPLRSLRRKLEGIADTVASSVWRKNFKDPLRTYPVLDITHLDYALPGCDACHLGSRMSTRIGRVSSSAYDRSTFEPLDDSDSSESDSEDNDSEDSKIEPSKVFHLGRFCARRTRIYHSFMHWEHTLYSAIEDEIKEAQGTKGRGYVRVAYAGGARPPKDRKDADGYVTWLDERGIVEMEWQKFKVLLKSASELEASAKRGDEDVD